MTSVLHLPFVVPIEKRREMNRGPSFQFRSAWRIKTSSPRMQEYHVPACYRCGQTGSEDCYLYRVNHDVIFGESFKPVPAVAGFQHPMRLSRLPAFQAIASGCQTSNHQEPFIPFRLHYGSPEAEGLFDRLLHRALPSGLFHHRGGNIARGNDAVLGRRRRMHHEGFVETRHIQLAVCRCVGRGSWMTVKAQPAACEWTGWQT